MDMIFGVFSEIYVRLLKSITSQFSSWYSKSYNNLNAKSCLKLNRPLTNVRAALGPSIYMYLIQLYKCSLEWSWWPRWPHIYFQCTFRIRYWFCLIFGSLGCKKRCLFHIKPFFFWKRGAVTMHNYAETCKGICGYNSVYTIFV